MANKTEGPIRISNYINGKFVPSYVQSFASYSPSNGVINAWIPCSGQADVDQAVQAATNAFKSWSQTTSDLRRKILNQIADQIEKNLEELAYLETMDQGKPLWQSKAVDIPRSVLNFRHFANSLSYQKGTSIVEPESGIVNYTIEEPVGVVGLITPWNLPLYLLTFKLAPAIAFGNTVVAKPSELTSVTAFRLAQLLGQTDLPNGVINFVFGYGATVGEAIVNHADVKLISFTGSTATGRRIAQQTASSFKRLSLEMGGKNAAIIFEDADLVNNVEKIARSVLFNSSQICLATSRILVHESIYDQFLPKFIECCRSFKIGDPFDSETKVSAMISKDHLAKVQGYVELARNTAQLTYIEPQLNEKNKQGFFTGIAIVTEVKHDSPLMTEEIFGPVVCVIKFKNETEAIEVANSTCYGLSSTIWTASLDRMHRVAHRIQSGTVWGNCWLQRNLNMPFGGVKQSGTGREGTDDSREFYTNKKTICIALDLNSGH
ncbi:hypothetical protein RDWZM_006636 [Blomia tropicalis]|uniref:Aldehyde dehydrogenase domain-containing protein n=1 Tax=Blomia tropicalis TaxID=40697 RepID=A0A9Q0RNI7_BLOTA|nr:hypothetical protein RDWZM_006636 [Blomia tropicalis]